MFRVRKKATKKRKCMKSVRTGRKQLFVWQKYQTEAENGLVRRKWNEEKRAEKNPPQNFDYNIIFFHHITLKEAQLTNLLLYHCLYLSLWGGRFRYIFFLLPLVHSHSVSVPWKPLGSWWNWAEMLWLKSINVHGHGSCNKRSIIGLHASISPGRSMFCIYLVCIITWFVISFFFCARQHKNQRKTFKLIPSKQIIFMREREKFWYTREATFVLWRRLNWLRS